MVTRGFTGRQSGFDPSDRIPPGQHLVQNFPVLSAGPAPRIAVEDWKFTLKVGPRPVKTWSWAEFNALPQTRMTRDIHCVTAWSKLDTTWEGVTVDDILADAGLVAPTAFVLAQRYRMLEAETSTGAVLSTAASVVTVSVVMTLLADR